MMKRALVVIALLASTAHAEPEKWYRGKYGKNRVTHVVVTGGTGVAFALTETLLKPHLAPLQCRWCVPDSFDASVRNSIVWSSPSTAKNLSNLDGYVVTPLYILTMTAAASLYSDNSSVGQLIDDMVPVLESAGISELLCEGVKFAAGRARPYAHFNPPAIPGSDDNVSFFSGHSTLVFSLATSAGVIAHERHYATEPYVWIGGYALAASTAYLRMAADEHYLTDILTGSAVGVAAGLTVPMLMPRSDRDVMIVPQPGGMAIAGRF